MNSLNGTITTGNSASLGRNLHELEVNSDRHHATASKIIKHWSLECKSVFLAWATKELKRGNG